MKEVWSQVPKEIRSKEMSKLKKEYWKKQTPEQRKAFGQKLAESRKKKV